MEKKGQLTNRNTIGRLLGSGFQPFWWTGTSIKHSEAQGTLEPHDNLTKYYDIECSP